MARRTVREPLILFKVDFALHVFVGFRDVVKGDFRGSEEIGKLTSPNLDAGADRRNPGDGRALIEGIRDARQDEKGRGPIRPRRADRGPARIGVKIVAALPDKIYLSFDIDGLDPKLCPHTGTPVAGGFETEQVLFLLEKVVKSGKKIIAFDINEVTPGPKGDDWDANVAARLLYRIANMVAHSQGRKP